MFFRNIGLPFNPIFVTGLETSPSLECGRDEVHINGDIAFGIMQYLYMTGDTKVLTDDKFGEILMGVGDYWLGRVSWNDSTNMYDLKGKTPMPYCFRQFVYYPFNIAK